MTVFLRSTPDFTARVGLTTSLDFKLELGSLSSLVSVEAGGITVDTDKSTVQGTFQANRIDELPLNGRNFLDLAQLAPGVQVVDGGTFDPTKNQFTGVSVGGRSGRSTRIQVDGVDITVAYLGAVAQSVDPALAGQRITRCSTPPRYTPQLAFTVRHTLSRAGDNQRHHRLLHTRRRGFRFFLERPSLAHSSSVFAFRSNAARILTLG